MLSGETAGVHTRSENRMYVLTKILKFRLGGGGGGGVEITSDLDLQRCKRMFHKTNYDEQVRLLLG